MGGGTLWHLQRFLQCIKYVKSEFISSTLLYSPSPDSWSTLNKCHFCIYTVLNSIPGRSGHGCLGHLCWINENILMNKFYVILFLAFWLVRDWILSCLPLGFHIDVPTPKWLNVSIISRSRQLKVQEVIKARL
jgi:hypothetical protein